jgi:outer membrane protein OmpA-like peptidoglycan-associated protein
MKHIITYLVVGILIFLSGFSFAQKQSDADLFKKGNSLITKGFVNSVHAESQDVLDRTPDKAGRKGNFNDALPIWKTLLEKYPDDPDVNFKVGLCYFNSYDKQTMALPFFEKAIKSMAADYVFKNKSGGSAPFFALYFLAETYFMNNQPDSALKYFALYQDKYEIAPISAERDIHMCLNAKKSLSNPRNVIVKNIGNKINTGFSETNPVVKLDDNMLFFASRRPLKTDAAGANSGEIAQGIYCSIRDASGNWGDPAPFSKNSEFDMAPLFLSSDGLTLYLSITKKEKKSAFNGGVLTLNLRRKDNSDIFVSHFENGDWSQPQPLKEINTKYSETGMSITEDGSFLYFASDRKGGYGHSDIYRSAKGADGKWETAENLGSVINSAESETSPSISPDGKILYFSSNCSAALGLGGYDVYYSELKDNGWTSPKNLGYPVNHTRDDVNMYMTSGGKRYYSFINGDQSYDIYEVIPGGPDAGEMNVSQAAETVKQVEKKVKVVEVTKAVEVEKEVEKRIEPKKFNEAEKKVKTEALVLKTVYFDFDKSTISTPSANELNQLAKSMTEHPEIRIEIIGNTDNKGSWEANLRKSDERAKKVYGFLLNAKIAPERMYYYGKAYAAPAASNDSDANRGKNRRVDVVVWTTQR